MLQRDIPHHHIIIKTITCAYQKEVGRELNKVSVKFKLGRELKLQPPTHHSSNIITMNLPKKEIGRELKRAKTDNLQVIITKDNLTR
jgi:hypothetical protein